MSFCVPGVALCDIPTCLITCRKCQNWRKSRTKCSFFCIHVSCLESLVFLWRRRDFGGSWKTWPFRMFPSRLSCCFAWQTWHFSRMRSKGSRFTLGVWGLRVCSLDVAFTVATVRNRPCDCYMAVPMVSSAEVVIFGGFRRLVASFRVAGVALRDIQRCFVTCRKSFCVAGAIFLRRFQKMCCSFRGRRSTLDVSIVIFSWQAQHFRRVALRVFCTSHWQGCVKWRQGANSVAGVAFCDMCWKLTEASHETSILRLQNVEVPRENS